MRLLISDYLKMITGCPYVAALLYALISYVYVIESVKLKFTNLECKEFDRPFATFKKCYLKALARDTVALYIHVALHKIPVTNVSMNAALFQRGNGYRPFLYNDTMDLCIFLKNPNRLMFWKIMYAVFKDSSNVNHTCPFNHDIIVDRLVLDASMFRQIPFPTNDYMVGLKFYAYNHYKAEVRLNWKIYD